MLTQVTPLIPRHLDPDAPACQPCSCPVSVVQEPLPPDTAKRFTVADYSQALRRCHELRQQHRSWTQARVRAQVAREMQVGTVTLRYLLRRAEALGLTGAPDTADAPLPAAA